MTTYGSYAWVRWRGDVWDLTLAEALVAWKDSGWFVVRNLSTNPSSIRNYEIYKQIPILPENPRGFFVRRVPL